MIITLQTILIAVLILVTLQLLFIGFYVITVLKELKKTVNTAQKVINDVDETVKGGLEKMVVMEKPLQALAAITAAVTGAVKAGGVIRRTTQSIIGAASAESSGSNSNSDSSEDSKSKKKIKIPKFFKRKA